MTVDTHPWLHLSVPAKRLPPPAFYHLPPDRDYHHPYCSVASASMLDHCLVVANKISWTTSDHLF